MYIVSYSHCTGITQIMAKSSTMEEVWRFRYLLFLYFFIYSVWIMLLTQRKEGRCLRIFFHANKLASW